MDKQAVRETVWDAFEERGEARFPFPPHDRIPNFAGADAACDRLTDTDAWASASTLKCNPDAPQLPCDAPRSGTEKRCTSRSRGSATPTRSSGSTPPISSTSGPSTRIRRCRRRRPDRRRRHHRLGHLDARHARRSRGRAARRPRGRRLRGRHDRRRPNREGWGYSDLEWGVLSELGASTERRKAPLAARDRVPRATGLRPVTVGRSPTTARPLSRPRSTSCRSSTGLSRRSRIPPSFPRPTLTTCRSTW